MPNVDFKTVLDTEKEKGRLSHLTNLATARIKVEANILDLQKLIEDIDAIAASEYIDSAEVLRLYKRAGDRIL